MDDCLLHDLPIKEISALSVTGSIGRQVVQDFKGHAYQIELFLCPFMTMSQYKTFRVLQALTGLLISGSAALQFLDRVRYPGTNLNLYVNQQFNVQVHAFLVKIGYNFLSSDGNAFHKHNFKIDALAADIRARFQQIYRRQPCCDPAILTVFCYNNVDGMKIDVTMTLFSPFQAIVGLLNICTMNVISYVHAISLYPKATFVDRVTCQTESYDIAVTSECIKYNERGWNSISQMRALLCPEFQRERRVGDQYSWVLPLRHEDFPPIALSLDMVFTHGWRYNSRPDSPCMFEWRLLNRSGSVTDIGFSGDWYVCRILNAYLQEEDTSDETW
ncbi:uncharacterized protein EV420DRAFT_1273618 [Desarmillaria tabescens]|uniref:Uncharacterized protein n=1 Tax=Armillaria tabescens TaxID=1929756 RepID=A0AA39N0M1_ARMTA|nr:uncharacterized protein EV420DRAFT_1273618 [Desarmillaria tabescens]KAK0452810.1 hypothetical protein EV420DRAFT_1273618 [Desarmillaria tabescens]